MTLDRLYYIILFLLRQEPQEGTLLNMYIFLKFMSGELTLAMVKVPTQEDRMTAAHDGGSLKAGWG